MNKTVSDEIKNELIKRGVIAVLEIENVEDAYPTAQALLDGGISAIELALRTKAAEPSIEIIVNKVPEMLVGIGTVIMQGQATKVKSIGAHFGVAPGFNKKIVEEAIQVNLSFIPGICTPSEIEGAIQLGCRTLKFFPAEPSGGINFLKSMNGPYNYLNLSYIPLGGLNMENLEDYAKLSQVIAIGGSWIAKRELINSKDWRIITNNAKLAKKKWDSIKNK